MDNNKNTTKILKKNNYGPKCQNIIKQMMMEKKKQTFPPHRNQCYDTIKKTIKITKTKKTTQSHKQLMKIHIK